jgi:hypothetical protein
MEELIRQADGTGEDAGTRQARRVEMLGGRSRVHGAGSRARSRELGYADAMRDMSFILRAGMKSWQRAEMEEAEAGQLRVAAAMGSVAAWLERYADFAGQVWDVHVHPQGTFAREVEHLAFLEREYGYPPARREPPQRERSESD